MVDGARLESVYAGNRIVGSNPTLTAIACWQNLKNLCAINARQRSLSPASCLFGVRLTARHGIGKGLQRLAGRLGRDQARTG